MAFPSSPSTNQIYNDGTGNWIYSNSQWLPYAPESTITVFIAGSINAGTAAINAATLIVTASKTTALISNLKEPVLSVTGTLLDLSLANVFYNTVTANIAFTPINANSKGAIASFILELTNGGAFTVTWWPNIKWNAGSAPTLTAAGLDVLEFYTIDNGATWRGFVLAQAVA